MAWGSSIGAIRLIGQAIAAGCLLPAVGLAQHRIVGPDGRITYTDRPPAAAPASRPPAQDAATATPPRPALPYELRAVATRYPVTLYATRPCTACDAGRQLLRQRGIPYSERLVADGDGELLQRRTGGREVPALAIGSQVLRGFAADQWTSYLDAAGYPRQSRLPATYPLPAAVPLDERRGQAAPEGAPGAPATNSVASPPPASPPPPGGIRF